MRAQMARICLSVLPEFCARYPNLRGRQAECDQVSIDSRCISSRRALFVALPGQQTDGHRYLRQAQERGALFALVKSDQRRSVDSDRGHLSRLQLIPVADPLRALQQLAGAHRQRLKIRVVAITGSRGKTLCKDLLHHLLEKRFSISSSSESFNSQIGTALSLLAMREGQELGLLECGISRPGEMDRLADMLRPDHAIFTHLGSAHLQTMGSLQVICREKVRLLKSVARNWCLLPSAAAQILAADDCALRENWIVWDDEPLACTPCEQTLRASRRGAYRLRLHDKEVAIASSPDIPLATVSVAVRAAQLLGLCAEEIVGRLRCFRHDPMRLEMWRSPAGYLVINDFYCADFVSLAKSLSWSRQFARPAGKRILWFGGLKRARGSQSQQRTLAQRVQGSGLDRILSPVGNLRARTSQLSRARELLSPGDQLLVRGAVKFSVGEIARALRAPMPAATLQINLGAIEHNVGEFCRRLPQKTAVMAMIKAMAYGTDSEILAKFLAKCRVQSFGLASVDEAIALRRCGVTHPLVALHADKEQWCLVPEWDLQICVSTRSEIEGLARWAKRARKSLALHLHVDTGMCRLGCRPRQALGLARLIQSLPELELEGLMSHFTSADDTRQLDFTAGQRAELEGLLWELRAAEITPRFVHIANSAGALRAAKAPFNLVRMGLALYGLYPDVADRGALDLQPALTLKVRIVQIQRISRGESVSYGRAYRAWRSSEKIAVLPLGYADGLHRCYSGRCSVVVRGKKAPLVGAICMDFVMVDVTEIPGCRVGDSALIFGEDEWGNVQDPLALAAELQANPHELISSLGSRVQRVFTYANKPRVV